MISARIGWIQASFTAAIYGGKPPAQLPPPAAPAATTAPTPALMSGRRKRARRQQRETHEDEDQPAAAAVSSPSGSGSGSHAALPRADGLDDLSLAGLLSDGSGDEGDPSAATQGRQFYASVDRASSAAAAAAAAAPAPAAAAPAAAGGGGRRKRSRPQRRADHTTAELPGYREAQAQAPGAAAAAAAPEAPDIELDDSEDDEPAPARRRKRSAGSGSALADAEELARNHQRDRDAADRRDARQRAEKRAARNAAAAAEAAQLQNTHIVLAARRDAQPQDAAAPELSQLSGTVAAAAARHVLPAVHAASADGVELLLTRMPRDAACDAPAASGEPQVHTALDVPAVVLSALLALQDAGWVRLRPRGDLLSPADGAAPESEQVTLAAAICFTPASFEDTAPAIPLNLEAEALRRRRALAKQVKHVMVWARPEQFRARRTQDSSSSSSSEEEGDEDQPAADSTKRKVNSPRFDAKSLFPQLSATHKAGAGRTWPQRPEHALLRSELRHYQRAAAEWMIERETAGPATDAARPHPLWARVCPRAAATEAAADDRKDFYYYQLAEGWLSRTCPVTALDGGPPIRGGILADEMGLGKTVELLYCVVHHPKPTTAPIDLTGAALGAAAAAADASGWLADRAQLVLQAVDDTQEPLSLGAWWHRKGSEEDISADAYRERFSAPYPTAWTLIKQPTDLGDDLDLYLDSTSAAIYSRGDASKLPLLTLITLLLDALENLRDEEQPWRVRSEIFMELPDRKKLKDYYTAIAQPIAFETMREKVSARGYTTLEEFQQDVQLLVANARQFNVATSPIFHDAVAIETSLAHLCRFCDHCRHVPPPGHGYTSTPTPAADDAADDDDDGVDGDNGEAADTGSEFLCAAHWRALEDAVKRRYTLDLKNDGVHINLCCSCCKAKHDVPTSDLPDDGEDMDVVDWYCSDCETDIFSPGNGDDSELIESSTTLIVCPSAICQQWVNEIAKHVTAGKFRVHVYNGLRSGERTTAKKLAMQHIVITTYDVLRQEVHHSPAYQAAGQGRAQRYHKKHRVVPTPLTALRWWRVCLDEAQMVETTTANASKMAGQLHTVNRWAVTGTPIAHGLDDLYGLVTFLRAEPLDNRGWWLNAIKKPCEAVVPAAVDQYHAFFCRIMWRSARVDVVDQLRLPPQHEHTEVLEFSDIEAYYYERQHRECLAAAKDILRKYKDLPSTEPILDKRWLQPFLRLRQACCHHQIGQASKTFLKGKSATERPLTMAELTERLLSKAKIEAEEAQRLMLMAVNALAALVLLDDQRPQAENHARAVELYREVLQIAEQHIERYQFKTDDLQRIHASINLGLLIQQENADEAAKLRESALELRKNYSKLESSDFVRAKQLLTAATQELTTSHPDELFEPTAGEPWWTRVASVVEESGRSEDFIERLRRDLAELAGGSREGTGIMLQFRDMRGLVYVLRSQLATTWTARKKTVERIRTLSEHMADEDARLAGNCKECRPWGKGHQCRHCEVEKSVILPYEQRLYSLTRDARRKNDNGDDDATDLATPAGVAGPMNPQVALLAWNMKEHSKKTNTQNVSRSPAEPEIALTALLRFISGSAMRDHPDVEELRTAGDSHLKAIEQLKKEFDQLREVWLTQREVLYRTDELLMSEMRIRVRGDGEEVLKEEEHYVLQSMEEVRSRTQEFEAEQTAHMIEFQEAKGRFSYVRNLKTRQDLGTSGEAEPCPVCHEPLSEGSDIMITPCGHAYCYFCIMKIFERFTSNKIACPICKKQVHKEDMNHVRERKALPGAGNAAGGAALARAAEASGNGTGAVAAAAAEPEQEGGGSAAAAAAGTPAAAGTSAAAAAGAPAAVGSSSAAAAAGGSAAPAASGGSQMRPEAAVKGDFGTKVDALIVLLHRISMPDRSAKTIVFSQWAGVLQIVSVGLAANGILFADAFSKGGRQQDKAIQTFKASPKVNVLLLATKSGANGLNLTEATNVILVEPVMSPAVEAQAVSRVLRIGQTKDTHVYRLVVKGTIEEQIINMQHKRVAGKRDGSPAGKGAATAAAAAALGSPRRGRRGGEDELTVADLRSLFAGHVTGSAQYNGANSAASAIDLAATEDEAPLAAEDAASFWKATVVYNTRDHSREDAANAIKML